MAPETTREIETILRRSIRRLAKQHRQQPQRHDRDGYEEPPGVLPQPDSERRALVECEGQRHQTPQRLAPLERESLERPALRDQVEGHDHGKDGAEYEVFRTQR